MNWTFSDTSLRMYEWMTLWAVECHIFTLKNLRSIEKVCLIICFILTFTLWAVECHIFTLKNLRSIEKVCLIYI